jgi:hypothetical protein
MEFPGYKPRSSWWETGDWPPELWHGLRKLILYILFSLYTFKYFVSWVAQWVYCLTTDWMTRVWSLTEAEDFSPNLCIPTSFGAHPASCTVGTGVLFLGVKCGWGMMLTTHPF